MCNIVKRFNKSSNSHRFYIKILHFFSEFMAGKLPTVPEEQSNDYKSNNQNWLYSDLDLFQSSTAHMPVRILTH